MFRQLITDAFGPNFFALYLADMKAHPSSLIGIDDHLERMRERRAWRRWERIKAWAILTSPLLLWLVLVLD